MSNNYKRNVCFTFFESYLQQGELIKEQFGDEKCAEYFISLIRYALYEETPVDPIIRIFITGLMNTIDANQEKRKRGFDKEDTELTQNIIDYKNQNPDSTQREIAEACKCSPAKVNKVLKNSNYPNSNPNANDNSNLNINTVNVNTNTFSCCETEKEEKKELEDLTDKELNELLQEYKKKTPYVQLYKKYHLKDNLLDKKLPEIIDKINRNRKAQKEIEDTAEMFDTDISTISELEKCFQTTTDGVPVCIELIRETANRDVNVNSIINFFRTYPEYMYENQPYSESYLTNLTDKMIELEFI